jgi:hypothetical protein
MTGARARALHGMGFTRPEQLAVADEEDVRKAVSASIPKPKDNGKQQKGAKQEQQQREQQQNALLPK